MYIHELMEKTSKKDELRLLIAKYDIDFNDNTQQLFIIANKNVEDIIKISEICRTFLKASPVKCSASQKRFYIEKIIQASSFYEHEKNQALLEADSIFGKKKSLSPQLNFTGILSIMEMLLKDISVYKDSKLLYIIQIMRSFYICDLVCSI